GLAPEAQALDQRFVARLILLLEIVEKAAALRDHFQKAATRMIVFLVAVEMRRQVGDPLTEDRDLDFRRAGVLGALRVLFDYSCFAIRCDRHRYAPSWAPRAR